jgi:hypothetical protein
MKDKGGRMKSKHKPSSEISLNISERPQEDLYWDFPTTFCLEPTVAQLGNQSIPEIEVKKEVRRM